ncbi:MAG: hypothetical protein J6X42_04085 [Alphaproteobacteria bacterium]|nr:hypothetical protein [Alphaproteobacteria bacterium]
MKETFDHIISLGYNCQTAFAIQAMYYGKTKPSSSFFNWVFCHSVANIINFFDHPEKMFGKGMEFSRESFMYKDVEMGLSYHSKIPHLEKISDGLIEKSKAEVMSRMTYLKNKFFANMKSESKNLYVLVYPSWENKAKLFEYIKALSEALQKYCGNKNSKLMIVFEKKYIKKIDLPSYDNVIYRVIRKHSVVSRAHEIDFFGWYFNVLKGIKILNVPKKSLLNIYRFKCAYKITFFHKIIKRS